MQEEGIPPEGAAELSPTKSRVSLSGVIDAVSPHGSPSSEDGEDDAAGAERTVLTLQAESAEEFDAWREVLTEATTSTTVAKKASLVSHTAKILSNPRSRQDLEQNVFGSEHVKAERELCGQGAAVHAWLSTIPIGGEEERRYDPSELLEFAWAQGLEEERPETLYMLFVEHQHTQGLLKAERMEQEMRMSVHDSFGFQIELGCGRHTQHQPEPDNRMLGVSSFSA